MARVGRRYFTGEFKREAVVWWETSGRMQTDVARELGIMPPMRRRRQRTLQISGVICADEAALDIDGPHPG